ncbi:hypothetical protein ACSFA8_26655 [Variovorax sp. RT4R15]|uniref:hypothetical protein n=1 Tax=Variovorax sp. RT4R15 TaxID=3443737 RepID=UPI003F44801D
MTLIPTFILCLFIGVAALLNKFAAKGRFFNGAYMFLFISLPAAPIHFATHWTMGLYEGAGTAAGIWLWPSLFAWWLGKKFVAKHPFSYPSVLWTKSQTPEAEKPDAPSNVTTSANASIPSWMSDNKKPWSK